MSNKLHIAILGVLIWAVTSAPAVATPFRLIKDVYPGNPSGTASLVASGDHLYFWGTNGVDGAAGQPWRSDGTVSGTNQVGVFLGSSGAYYGGGVGVLAPYEYHGVVYFVANDGIFGTQLWRTDGTPGGTLALTNLANTTISSFSGFVGVGDLVTFIGPPAAGVGTALWSTGGTIGTTQILSNTIAPNSISRGVTLNGYVLYAGFSGPSKVFIVTDGTVGGTGSYPRTSSTYDFPVAVNEIVYFRGDGATSGFGRGALWKTDGVVASILMDFSDVDDSSTSTPYALTRVDDRMFFSALRPGTGRELWTSNGTPAGTQPVKDIRLGLIDSAPDRLVGFNGKVYFSADDGINGRQLWSSDGTDPGTQPVYSFASGAQNPFDSSYNTIQVVNHKLVVVVNPHSGSSGAVPYVSDGTMGGTHILDSTNIAAGNGVAAVGGQLFAAGAVLPSNLGNELIAADGFAALGTTWCANPEQAIPDENGTGIFMTSRSYLPSHGGIAKLTVSVDIGHTYVGDLQIKLRHEQTATEVVLLDQPNLAGNCSGALLDIVLDDSAATGAQGTCANTRPAYPRDQSFMPLNPLSAFNGQSLKGDWTITVTDKASGDKGILHEWCMNFTSDLIFTNGLD